MNKNRRRALFQETKKFALNLAKELYPSRKVYWNKVFGLCVDDEHKDEVVTIEIKDVTTPL